MMLATWLLVAILWTILATIIVLKEKAYYTSKLEKKNTGSRMGAQLFSCLDQLVNNILMADDCTLISENKKWCSIKEDMQQMHSIDGVNFGNGLHTFSTII